MQPVMIDNVFSDKRFSELLEYFKSLIFVSGIEQGSRTMFDSINNPILQMLGQELLPIAKKAFNNENIFSVKTTFAHYEGIQGILRKHKDKQPDTMVIDVCMYEDIPWGIVIEDKDYIFPVNSAVAFKSGQVDHWRKPNPDPKNNKTGVLLAYYNELTLDIYSPPVGE
jgi:hypothetical protein